MKQAISIGIQDFESLRQNQWFYVDKSRFIREWWNEADTVTLITRPHRFANFPANQYQTFVTAPCKIICTWQNSKRTVKYYATVNGQ